MAIRDNRIQEVLKRYSSIQDTNNEKILTAQQKKAMVEELKKLYDSLTEVEKCDVLVPADWRFVSDHAILHDEVSTGNVVYDLAYNWPKNDGFYGKPSRATLLQNEEYDRIGGPKGKFLAPLSDSGVSQTYFERALPYYIPERNICDSPAYHRYKVIMAYSGEGISEDKSVLRGVVAPAFWNNPKDGGGTQVKLPRKINQLGSVLNDITKS